MVHFLYTPRSGDDLRRREMKRCPQSSSSRRSSKRDQEGRRATSLNNLGPLHCGSIFKTFLVNDIAQISADSKPVMKRAIRSWSPPDCKATSSTSNPLHVVEDIMAESTAGCKELLLERTARQWRLCTPRACARLWWKMWKGSWTTATPPRATTSANLAPWIVQRQLTWSTISFLVNFAMENGRRRRSKRAQKTWTRTTTERWHLWQPPKGSAQEREGHARSTCSPSITQLQQQADSHSEDVPHQAPLRSGGLRRSGEEARDQNYVHWLEDPTALGWLRNIFKEQLGVQGAVGSSRSNGLSAALEHSYTRAPAHCWHCSFETSDARQCRELESRSCSRPTRTLFESVARTSELGGWLADSSICKRSCKSWRSLFFVYSFQTCHQGQDRQWRWREGCSGRNWSRTRTTSTTRNGWAKSWRPCWTSWQAQANLRLPSTLHTAAQACGQGRHHRKEMQRGSSWVYMNDSGMQEAKTSRPSSNAVACPMLFGASHRWRSG